jgi:hypothetical protein
LSSVHPLTQVAPKASSIGIVQRATHPICRRVGGLAIVAAIILVSAAAFGFAVSSSLQHRVAGQVPVSIEGGLTLLRYLASKPTWNLGILLGALSFSLHATALHYGAIAVVQPIMACGVIFAVPVRAWLEHERPAKGEGRSVSIAVVGLIVFLSVTETDPNVHGIHTSMVIVFDAVGLLLAVGLVRLADRVSLGRQKAQCLGAATGIVFAMVAGMLKVLTECFNSYGVLSWQVFAALGFVAGCGLTGTILNNRAYRVAPLSMSMPVVNIVNVLISGMFGWWALGAAPSGSWFAVLVQAFGLVIMWFGVREIARAHEAAEAASGQREGPAVIQPEIGPKFPTG